MIQRAAIRAADRKVLHAQQQLGVGQFAGGNRGTSGRLEFFCLSGERRRVVFGQPQGFIEGQWGSNARQRQYACRQGSRERPPVQKHVEFHVWNSCHDPLRAF